MSDGGTEAEIIEQRRQFCFPFRVNFVNTTQVCKHFVVQKSLNFVNTTHGAPHETPRRRGRNDDLGRAESE